MNKATAVACVMVVIVCAVAISPYTSTIEDGLKDIWDGITGTKANQNVSELTEGNLTISGDIANYVSIDTGAGHSTVTCSLGGDISWYLKDTEGTYYVKNGDVYTERDFERRDGPMLIFTEPGRYEIKLYRDGTQLSTGTLTLDGTICKEYEWKQQISWSITYEYSIAYKYRFSDYLERADDPSAVRKSSPDLPTARFAVTSDVKSLEEALRAEYLRVHGTQSSMTGQDYANFLLSFVQCCIEYPDRISEGDDGIYRFNKDGVGELFLYGVDEYWAYPLETIHHGYGDCEDTSFLAAALFKVAGYTSGVMELPDHMVACVGLSYFTWPSSLRYVGMTYTAMVLKSTQETLYFCETTTDEFYDAGFLNESNSAAVNETKKVSLVNDQDSDAYDTPSTA